LNQNKRIELSMPVIHALMMYWYNTRPYDIIDAVYDNPAPAYADEKVAVYKEGLHIFWGQIDRTHQRRLVDAAMAKYGEHCEEVLKV